MRGASLATALRELGKDESGPQRVDASPSVDVAESGTSQIVRPRTSELADSVPPHRLVANTTAEPALDDEEAPAALRPDELARWLERSRG
jgi:hypothetical protein